MVKKKTKKTARRRSIRKDDGLVEISRVELKLDLSPSGARELRSSLEAALAAHDGNSWSAQVRIDARDLNSIYLYLGPAETEKIVARLAEVSQKRGSGDHR